MSFNLYQTLNKNIKNTDLKPSQKKDLISKINTLNGEELEALTMLIYEHYNLTDKDIENIPYKGIETDKGMEFNLSELPITLRQIIYKFINIQKN